MSPKEDKSEKIFFLTGGGKADSFKSKNVARHLSEKYQRDFVFRQIKQGESGLKYYIFQYFFSVNFVGNPRSKIDPQDILGLRPIFKPS